MEERADILIDACQEASLEWLVDISVSAYGDHHPRSESSDREPKLPERYLMTQVAAHQLRTQALSRIRQAACDGSLLLTKDLAYVLFRWRDMEGDKTDVVVQWSTQAIASNDSLVILAKAFLSVAYSYSIGDRVTRRQDRANVDGLETLMDVTQFRSRLAEVSNDRSLDQENRQIVQRLLEAWQARDHGDD